jgi:hypothetical protein
LSACSIVPSPPSAISIPPAREARLWHRSDAQGQRPARHARRDHDAQSLAARPTADRREWLADVARRVQHDADLPQRR